MKKLFLLMMMLGVSAGILNAQKADKKADKVIDQYLKAVGGKKLDKVDEVLQKMTFKANGQEMQTEILTSKKGRGYMKMNMGGMEFVIYAYKGDKGFMMNQQMGYDEIPEEQLKELKEQKQSYLHGLDNYQAFDRKYLGTKTVDGKEYEVVELSKDGQTSLMYFNPKNHLLEIIITKNPETGMETATYLLDYKDFDGVKFPTKMQIRQGDMVQQEITVDEVKLNPQVDESVFEMPE